MNPSTNPEPDVNYAKLSDHVLFDLVARHDRQAYDELVRRGYGPESIPVPDSYHGEES